MIDNKNPPPDFETARKMLAEPGFFEDGIAQIEALRGQLGDELTNDLIDGARRLYERSKIPLEQIVDDDPTLSRTECAFVIAFLMEMIKREVARDFFVLDDLKSSKPAAYRSVLEIDRKLSEPCERKFSEVASLVFQFYLIVRQARTGLDIAIYLQSLEPFLDALRGFYDDRQLNAFAQKVKAQLQGEEQN